MGKKKEENYAFIDAQNLYLNISKLGWKIDYNKLFIYLKEKYLVAKAYMFIGYISNNWKIYCSLEKAGFILIFKSSTKISNNIIKGNCDAEMILRICIEFWNYDKAILITGDGDFSCIIDVLEKTNKLKTLLSPDINSCNSIYLKLQPGMIEYVSSLKDKIEHRNENAPLKTEQ